MYPDIDPKGKWVKEVLLAWNPFIARKNGKFGLSDLGRDFVALPGKKGAKPTASEKGFLLGVMILIKENMRANSCIGRPGASKMTNGHLTRRNVF